MLEMRKSEWELAYSQFQVFRNSLRGLIDEDCISEYHRIVESLQQAGDENLDTFRIDKNKMEFLLVQAKSGEHIDPRVGVQYSNKKYCDWEYFWDKIEQLQEHLRLRGRGSDRYEASRR